MQIKLENPVLLSKAVELASELVTEVKFKLNSSGMSVIAIDPANVAMVRFFLAKSAFSQFEVANEELGVNLDDLKNILNIEIQDKIKRNFELSLIELDKEDKEMPKLEFSSRIEMNSIVLIDAVEDCSVVADSCSFIVENEKFIIEARSLNSARAEFSGDEAKIEAENCKSKYSLEYLQKFIKGSKLCEKTVLNFANDHPLKIDLKIDALEMNFVLAPRVDRED